MIAIRNLSCGWLWKLKRTETVLGEVVSEDSLVFIVLLLNFRKIRTCDFACYFRVKSFVLVTVLEYTERCE